MDGAAQAPRPAVVPARPGAGRGRWPDHGSPARQARISNRRALLDRPHDRRGICRPRTRDRGMEGGAVSERDSKPTDASDLTRYVRPQVVADVLDVKVETVYDLAQRG